MGAVVTINSATLVNKGLEIIEAHYLFSMPYSAIEAVIHRQSVVHSMVEFRDGSTIAQASPPNMRGQLPMHSTSLTAYQRQRLPLIGEHRIVGVLSRLIHRDFQPLH
jgi:1-deoxy-D-xylulose 5-phosphate reductoisomerase